MGDGCRYRAFLSYSHADRRWADWLHGALERYRIPPRLQGTAGTHGKVPNSLRPVFRDRAELASASSLPDVINEALRASAALIVICSPSAARSRWVAEEIRRFQALGRGDRIFCIVVAGDPLARGGELDCFPSPLRHPAESEGGSRSVATEPIAADARGGRSARAHAKYMLIAGLLGIGLDELLQRDLHQRHRRLFAVATLSSVLAIAMAGLAVRAFLAEAESERRRADAENLVGFMLGDLREDLHSIGRLDLYRSVADQAMEYFRSLGDDKASDEVLAQRALALRQIGSSRLELGDTRGALEAFGEALTISASVAQRNPDRLEWRLALAESYFSVGEVYWRHGDYDSASSQFTQQLAVVDSLTTAHPENPELLAHAGYAWTNFGRVQERAGRTGEALAAYENVMAIFQRLLRIKADDVDARLEVGFAHNNLGKLKMEVGRLAEAERHMQEDFAIKRSVADAEPNHNLWLEYLAASHYWLARVQQCRGSFAAGRGHADAALQLLDELLETDSSVTRWRQRRAAVGRTLGSLCRMQGDRRCAAVNIANSMDDLDQLLALDSNNNAWRRERALSALEAAWQATSEGNLKAAGNLANVAMRLAEDLVAQAPDDRDALKALVFSLLTLGDLADLRSERETALANWNKAEARIVEGFPDLQDPEVLESLALLQARLNRADRASELRDRLSEMGYRGAYPLLAHSDNVEVAVRE